MSYHHPNPKFPVGARVTVTRNMHRYAENLVGLVGTVDDICIGTVPVVFDEITNPRSGYGRFYINAECLKVVDDDINNKMEDKTMHKITNYFNVVKMCAPPVLRQPDEFILFIDSLINFK